VGLETSLLFQVGPERASEIRRGCDHSRSEVAVVCYWKRETVDEQVEQVHGIVRRVLRPAQRLKQGPAARDRPALLGGLGVVGLGVFIRNLPRGGSVARLGLPLLLHAGFAEESRSRRGSVQDRIRARYLPVALRTANEADRHLSSSLALPVRLWEAPEAPRRARGSGARSRCLGGVDRADPSIANFLAQFLVVAREGRSRAKEEGHSGWSAECARGTSGFEAISSAPRRWLRPGGLLCVRIISQVRSGTELREVGCPDVVRGCASAPPRATSCRPSHPCRACRRPSSPPASRRSALPW